MDNVSETTKAAAKKNIDNVSETVKSAAKKIGDKAQKVAENMADRVQSLNGGRDEVTDHREGPVARVIEYQTARLPSDAFLWGAGAAIGASLFFQMRGKSGAANFIGQWAPTFLIMGLYNKIVKVAGSDRLDQQRPIFGKENGGEAKALH